MRALWYRISHCVACIRVFTDWSLGRKSVGKCNQTQG